MDKKNKHIEQLTPELIQAYHSGTLTSVEMHQVEILLLESPLYNEGMEGLQSLSTEEFALDIDTLSAKIDQATEEEKVGFWTTWRKSAAVILVLITASGLFYFNQPTDLPTKELSEANKSLEPVATDSSSSDDDTQAAVALDEKSKEETVTDLPEKAIVSVPVKPTENEAAKEVIIAPPTLARKTEDIETLPAPKALTFSNSNFEKKDERIAQETLKLKGEAELDDIQISITQESAKRKLSTNDLKSSFFSESKPLNSVANLVKGKVVGSDDGLPLPQVTVLERGTTNGTQTNEYGEFNFANLKPNTTLVFRYLGYITQEIKISFQDTMKISLSPDATSLGEVVVTGVAAATPEKKLPFNTTTIEGGTLDGTRAKTNVGNTQSSTRAKPENGFSKFNRYLKKNLKYPELAKALKLKGQVTVEFRVSTTGELFDFRIIKGLGSGCDEEAIRLIKEGPKWKPKTLGTDKRPVLSIVTVKVRFKP